MKAMTARSVLILSGLLAGLIIASAGDGRAQENGAKSLPRIDQPTENSDVPDASMVDSEAITGAVMNEKDMLQYCVNISDDAREARYALIKRELAQKESEIEEKLGSLDGKLKAIKEYVDVRNQFQAAAEAQVVTIFATMRPDSAAQQLAALDPRLAAAIIMKLDPKIASVILGEMKPKVAATLASFLTAAMMPEDKTEVGQ